MVRLQEQARYTFGEMQDDARTLGIEFDRLGGLFAKAKIDDTANRYTQALARMIEASGDPGMVLFESREALSQLVQDSLKAGVALPENMREWIEEMHRAGLLVDENGDALTDLSQLKFGERLKTEAEIISQAMERLEKIINRIADALSNLPGLPGFSEPRLPGTDPRPIPMASGGDFMVTRPTLFLAGEAGPERATFTPRGSSMGGGTSTVRVEVGMPDGRNLVDFVMRQAGNRWAVAAR
jgi:hypothetical protein